MKQFKFSIAWLAMFALIFTSCSKDEVDGPQEDQELIEISFRSLLNDFKNQNKQASPGECSEDGTPDYVLIGITDSDGNYVGDDGGTSDVNLIEIDLKWNTNLEVWETMYSPELALPAGNYTLQYFIVHGTDDEVLWVAPRTGGAFASDVSNPLPQPITLAAGTKPYITVDVLCYIAREEIAYGYLFFDINTYRAENSYCVFVNYCYDEDGREVPAHFMVEVWSDGYDGDDEIVLNDNMNSVDTSGMWPSASVLCFALPDIGDGVLYARLTILDQDYYDADPELNYIDFEITQDDIDAQELMVPAYQHFRYGCPLPPGDSCIPGDSNLPGDSNNDCVVDCRDTNTCEPGDCNIPGDTNGDCEVTCADDDSCEEPCDVPGDTNGDCEVTCADDNSCPVACDTAFMFGDYILKDHYPGNNWGWGLLVDGEGVDATYMVGEGEWLIPFYAGAGQNNISKGWRAGNVRIEADGDDVIITIEPYDNVTVGDTHFYFNDDGVWPAKRAHGSYDMGDGGLSFTAKDVDGTLPYAIIVHGGDTCMTNTDN